MIQYYTAIGRYELRTGSNGAKQPVLLNSSRSYEPSLCEMLLWSSLLWHIRDQQELEIVFAKRKQELHICDEYSLAYYCTRLEHLGFLHIGSGYTAADALFELMAPLNPVPATAGFGSRLCSFLHLVFRRRVPLSVACRVLHQDRLVPHEQQIMDLLSQNSLSTAELIACIDQNLHDVRDSSVLMERIYSDSALTCDNLPAYVRASDHLIPVLQTLTNLYLRRLLVLERY
ncbi:hypothetical protein [uncultured Subdoligranulum sp.]|uniref:hypothetical protein n=1 Tax=uncultured Subdoligranulum sp. TaxID=512298 RepID=UPI0025E8976C|nr:hypothetical protein [uncultured Subdoligranulum sp.]